MAANRRSEYLVEEPDSGLFACIENRRARLTYRAHASRFPDRRAAIVAVHEAGLAEQPHEIVRVDA